MTRKWRRGLCTACRPGREPTENLTAGNEVGRVRHKPSTKHHTSISVREAKTQSKTKDPLSMDENGAAVLRQRDDLETSEKHSIRDICYFSVYLRS